MSTRIDCPDGYITFDIQEFNLTEKVHPLIMIIH